MKELAKHFDKIILYPLVQYESARLLPDNVSYVSSLYEDRVIKKKKLLFTNFRLIAGVLMMELIRSGHFFDAFLRSRTNLASLLKCLNDGEILLQNCNQREKNYFYSFWMNDGATILSLLKRKKNISFFSFRVNGFDLFLERRKNNYSPLRSLNFQETHHIIVLSKVGVDYLKSTTNLKDKFKLAFYGIYDNGYNLLTGSDVIRIVSCSGMIPLKRIDKIIQALNYVEFKVDWIHFGDGPLKDELITMALSLPTNIHVNFKGNISNTEIIRFYQTTPVHLFIHTSDTEGLGMAIIEAQSFGIPALAVAAGGVVDIVNDRTGRLVSLEDSPKQIAKNLIDIKNSFMFSEDFRKGVKQHWKEKFDAMTNYKDLAKMLSIKEND